MNLIHSKKQKNATLAISTPSHTKKEKAIFVLVELITTTFKTGTQFRKCKLKFSKEPGFIAT